MHSEEQPVNVSNSPSNADLFRDWPPSFLRLVLGGIIVAGLGYLVLTTIPPIFVVPVEIATFPEQSPVWMYERLEKTQSEVDGKNFSILFGIIGAIFGAVSVLLSFGAKSLKAITVAVVGTAALGVAGVFLSNWIFFHLRVTSGKEILIMGIALDSMKQTILGYSALWGLIGLGVGLGVGSYRGFGKALVAGISGLCGGVLGSMLYVLLTAQFFIGTTMNRVVPDSSTSQAVWMALLPIVIAACIALGSGEKRKKVAP